MGETRPTRALLVTFALGVAVLAAPVALALLGDVNDDTLIDETDAEQVREAVIGTRLLSGAEEAAADVDGDRGVDVLDAQLIQQFVAGQISGFPPRLPQSSSPVAVTRDGQLAGVVNPDSNSVSFVDTATDTLLAEVAVGSEPTGVAFTRDGGRAFVTNARDASVSVIETGAFAVVNEIPVGVEPFGVVVNFAGDRAYVSNMASATVAEIDVASEVVVGEAAVSPLPQGLAVTGDSSTLYVTHLRGDPLSVIDAATLSVSTVPLAEIPFDELNPTQPAGIPNRLKGIAIHPTQDEAWIPHILSNSGNFVEALFNTSIFPAIGVIDTSTDTEVTADRMTLFSGLATTISSAEAVAFSPDGALAYVVSAASNDLTILNVATRQEVGLLRDVGDNPRGIAVTPGGDKAYVFNRLTPELTVVDLGSETIAATIRVSTDSLPANLANGRRLFFTSALPEVARDRVFGCEACHFDGRDDGRVWFFTNGPRQTLTMAGGTLDTGLLHHNGDRADVQDFRFTFTRLQNGTGLTEDQLDDLADFTNQAIRHLENPFLNADGSRTAAARRGRRLFQSTGCADCHVGPFFTDAVADLANPVLHDVGIFAEGTQGQDAFDKTRDQDGIAGGTVRPAGAFESTFLLGVWATAPYLHDGRSATLLDVLTTDNPDDQHGVTSTLSAGELADLVAYLEQLDITNARVRIDYPRDGARVVDLFEVTGAVLPDVVSVEVFVDGQGPLAAMVANGRFTALVPPALVPAVGAGTRFDLTARATTADGEPGRDDVEVEANFGAGADAATSSVEASPALITADGASTSLVTVTPRDGSGDPVGAGLAIEVGTTLGTLSAVTDVGDGRYTAELTSAISIGNAIVTAREAGGGSFADDATVRFAAGDVEAATSTVTAIPGALEADGISTSVVTVVPRDAFANPLGPGQAVGVIADTGTLGAVLDRGDGSYTAIYTAPTLPALATLSTTVNGTALADVNVNNTPDVTAPGEADLARVSFGAPVLGISQVSGGAGSVEALSTVTVTNSATTQSAQTTAGGDGSYTLSLGVAPGEEVCVQVIDIAGNAGPSVCTVPFPPPPTTIIVGTVQAALAGGGFAPLPGELVELDLADLATDPCNPGFTAFLFGGQPLTDVTTGDGSFAITLPQGVGEDPNFAIVNGSDDDQDGIIDTIFAFAMVNDVERTALVDEVSTAIPFMICDNDLLLGNSPPPFPESNFSPEERTAIEQSVRDATAGEDFTDPAGALQVIADDVFFDLDGPKDPLDTVAFETFREAAESPGDGPQPVFVRGTVTVPSAGGDVGLGGVEVSLVTLTFDPLNAGAVGSAVTEPDGSFTLLKPAAVSEGPTAGILVVGELPYDGGGNPGTFDDGASLFSLGAFLTDASAAVAVDLAGRAALSLVDRDISDPLLSVTAANYNRSELDELTDLARNKIAGMALNLPNRNLSDVFLDVFNALLNDGEVAQLRASIRDPEPAGCNVSATPGTTLEADGHSEVAITFEPLDANSLPRGAGLLVEVATTLGTITNPTIDERDGLYTAFLRAPTTAGTARVTATLPDEGAECPVPLDVVFTEDTTAPAAPDPGRIVFTGLGGSTATVVGLPGSAEPFSRVTVENTTQGVSVSVLAKADGSFRADIPAGAGDALLVRSEDGAANTGPDTALAVGGGLVLPAIGNPAALPGGVTPTIAGLSAGDLGVSVPAGYTFLRGFSIDLEGQAALAPLDLLIERAVPVPPGVGLVLAQVIEVGGVASLRVVAPAAALGGLLFPLSDPAYPGLVEEGAYAYLAADTPLAFVKGAVTGTRGAVRDVLVTGDVSPFVDLSRDDGRYLLAAAVGADLVVSAAPFAHGTPTDATSLLLPFAAALVRCDFDLATRADRSFAHTGRFAPIGSLLERAVALPSGGRVYATSGNTGDAHIVDTASMTAASVAEDVVRIEDLAFTPNGFEAFVAYLNRVRDFTVAIEEPGLLITGVDFPRRVATTPDGGFALVASSTDNAPGDLNADAIYVIDTFRNAVEPGSIPVDADPSGLVVSRDGTRAYVTSETAGTLTVIDIAARAVLDVVAAGTQPEDVEVSPDGAELYVVDAASDELLVLDAALAEDLIAGNELLAAIAVGDAPSDVALTPDGSRLLVSDQNDDTLTLVDVASRSVVAVYAVGDLNASQALSGSAAVHPDGTTAYALDRASRRGLLEIPLAASDALAPRVVDAGPKNRRVDLLQDSPVEVVFSERIDPATVSGASVEVLDSATDVPFAGSVAPSGDGVGVVFTPAPGVRFPLNSTVKVVLGTALADLAGNLLPAAQTRFVPTVTMQLPDLTRVSVDLTTNGIEVSGQSGAVEPRSRVEVTNLTSARRFRALAGADGSFGMVVEGLDVDGYELVTSIFGGRARTDPLPLPVNFTIAIPDPTLVSYQAGPAGTLSAVGAAGAVDPQSSRVEIRNLTSGRTFSTSTVAANGSFEIGIFAAQGDSLELVSTILGAIVLDPVPLASPDFDPPVIDFISPDRFLFGDPVVLNIVGTDFGTVPGNILLEVGGELRTDFVLSLREEDPSQDVIQVVLEAGAGSGQLTVSVAGQTSDAVSYFAEFPENTSPFAEEVVSSSTAGDPAGALGASDAAFADLGEGGEITLRLGSTVEDGSGNDLQVFEDTSDGGDCYQVLVSASSTGPFDSLGQFCGTAFVDLAGHDPIRFVQIIDAADGGNAARIGGVFAIRVQISIGLLIDGDPVATGPIGGGLSGAAVSVSKPGGDKAICLNDMANFSVSVSPPPKGGGGYGGGCSDKVTWSVSGPGAATLSPKEGTSTKFTPPMDQSGSFTVTATVRRSGSGCSDTGTDSKSAKIDVIEVDSLLPDEGKEIPDGDGDPDTRTFVVGHQTSVFFNDVDVDAKPKPSVAASKLPACWKLTGGNAPLIASGKLKRLVPKDPPHAGRVITASAGSSSSKTTKIIILGITVESTSVGEVCDGLPAPLRVRPLPLSLPLNMLDHFSGITLESEVNHPLGGFGNPAGTTTLTFDPIAVPGYTSNVRNSRWYSTQFLIKRHCNDSSVYTIKATATLDGRTVETTDGTGSELDVGIGCIRAANPRVESTLGFTGSPALTTTPATTGCPSSCSTACFSTTVGTGTFMRNISTTILGIPGVPANSQYRADIVAEENFHFNQHQCVGTTMHNFCSLVDPARVFADVNAGSPYVGCSMAASVAAANSAFVSARNAEISRTSSIATPLSRGSLRCNIEEEAKAAVGISHRFRFECAYPPCQ